MYPAAVIFDFDGVIVDTEAIHYQSFQKVLNPIGLGYSWLEYQQKYMGFDDRDAFREVYKQSGHNVSDATLLDHIAQKAHIFEQTVLNGVTPYPGVLELITELYQQHIPMAIASGALRSDIVPILKQHNIENMFSCIVTADDVSQSKPDPSSYLLAMQFLLNSNQPKNNYKASWYAIEDTPAGIQSARSAGLRVIGITNSYDADSLLQADAIVPSLTDLLDGNWP